MLRTTISRNGGDCVLDVAVDVFGLGGAFAARALADSPAVGLTVVAFPAFGAFSRESASGLITAFFAGLRAAGLALVGVFLADPGLAAVALRLALPEAPRPAGALTGIALTGIALTGFATLALVAGLLLRTGLLAVGIFWTLLKI